MPFQLPPDNPAQQLTAQAEGLGAFVATYYDSLRRNGVTSEELVNDLVMQYAKHMLERFYPLNPPASPPPQPPTAGE